MTDLYRVLEDGTRVYRGSYVKYKPVPESERVYRVRKPDDPRAVRWKGDWLLPLSFIPDDSRAMPATRPDDDAYDHMNSRLGCDCEVCLRPEAERYRRRWRRERGLQP